MHLFPYVPLFDDQSVNIQDNALKFIPHKTKHKKRAELHVPLIDKARQLIGDEKSKYEELFLPIKEQKMNEALLAGYQVLQDGGTSVEAIKVTINIMEDSPLFIIISLLGPSKVTL